MFNINSSTKPGISFKLLHEDLSHYIYLYILCYSNTNTWVQLKNIERTISDVMGHLLLWNICLDVFIYGCSTCKLLKEQMIPVKDLYSRETFSIMRPFAVVDRMKDSLKTVDITWIFIGLEYRYTMLYILFKKENNGTFQK